MLVTSVGLARPSSVRIGLEATGSFKPHGAEDRRQDITCQLEGERDLMLPRYHVFIPSSVCINQGDLRTFRKTVGCSRFTKSTISKHLHLLAYRRRAIPVRQIT
jgi:hypothetical protein